jgi:hypothetical protein
MAKVTVSKQVSSHELQSYLSTQLGAEYSVSDKNSITIVRKGSHYGSSLAIMKDGRTIEVYPKVFATPLTIGAAVAIAAVGVLILLRISVIAGAAVIALNMFAGRIPALPCTSRVREALSKL